MFDINSFKQNIKVWIKKNPEANKVKFLDYCEELIPINEYAQYSWLLEQATMWFDNIDTNKKKYK